MQLKMHTTKRNVRRGISLIELVAAAAATAIVMTLVTTLCFRISLVWQDVGHHRVAIAELSNQLDRLTTMDIQQAENAMESLEPSDHCKRTLRSPQLSGKLVQTEIGTQINLQLNWKRRHPGKAVELAGWITGYEQQ